MKFRSRPETAVSQAPVSDHIAGGSGANYLRDVLLYFPAKALPAATGLLAVAVISRAMAPAEYANYSAIITICIITGSLAGGWIQQACLYLYPKYKSVREKFIGEIFKLQLFVFVPAALVAFTTAAYITKNRELAILAVLLLLVQVVYGLVTTLQRSLRTVKEQAISALVQSSVHISALVVAAKFSSLDSRVTVVCVLIGGGAGSVLAVAQLRSSMVKAGDGIQGPVDSRGLLRQVTGYGVPFSIWFVAFQLMISGDRLILTRVGAIGVGEYASVRDLVTGLAGLTTMPMLLAAHPVLLEMWQAGRTPAEIEQLISRNVNVVMLMLTLFVGIALLCGPEIMMMILGKAYRVERSILCLVVINIYIGAISMYAHKGLEISGQVWKMALAAVGVAIVNLSAFALVAPRVGVVGTALVGCGGMVLYLASVTLLSRKVIRMRRPSRLLAQSLWLGIVAILVAGHSWRGFSGSPLIWGGEAGLALVTYAFVVGIADLRKAATMIIINLKKVVAPERM